MKLPFSVYDFFAYLATGFVVLCAADYAFDGGWLEKDKLPTGMLIFLIVAGYVLGHFVAHLSSFFLEHMFLRKVLKSPEETLFKAKASGFWSYIFPIFYKPFPPETQQRVLAKAAAAGITKPGRGLFFHCFAIVKREKSTAERLVTFLNVYGFSRNVCMAALIAAVILAFAAIRNYDRAAGTGFEPAKLAWAGVSVAVAIVLFYRYLKFFKHYTQEVFRDYAELPGEVTATAPAQAAEPPASISDEPPPAAGLDAPPEPEDASPA
ncbi:hypothetical protein [Rubinisphaera margarita]|uniref:hypothetical protein n=1 Tax=Rubinisphaera margarita TaxID=2909586 RepID=UPI001EE9531B|nr:hypothetical protein [Rubinisphaera margarita]MCG6154189.1 hypothetical protein [Rubinisphaera margarita]